MGIAIAATHRTTHSGVPLLTGLLLLAAALIIHLLGEGFPAFPPVASKHKVMFVIVGYAVLLGASYASRKKIGSPYTWLASLVAFTIPVYWLGQNIFKANTTKSVTVAIILLIAFAILPLAVKAQRAPQRNAPSALLPALLATFIATAITSVLGGYIGMSTVAGALAAMTGGFLLIIFIGFLRGDNDAFSLPSPAALSFGWLAVLHVVMTALFTPNASAIGIVLCILPLVAAYCIDSNQRLFAGLPRPVQPIVMGVVAAAPAIIAIIIAFSI